MMNPFFGGAIVRGNPPRSWPLMASAAVVLVLLGLGTWAGCGSSSDEDSAALRAGIYEYELTKEYLLENGIPSAQAANESGMHQTMLDAGFPHGRHNYWTAASSSTAGGPRKVERAPAAGRMRRTETDSRSAGRVAASATGR